MKPPLQDLLATRRLTITDGAVETRILFETKVPIDELLGSVGLLLNDASATVLNSVYEGYVRVADRFALPMLLGTPTFRASAGRIAKAGLPASDVARLNQLAVRTQQRLAAKYAGIPVYISGVLGPSGDAYQPAQQLSAADAAEYHAPQARALAEAGVDVLTAATFPSVDESLGAARAMAATGTPYAISYVIHDDGTVLDGTPLPDAVERLDRDTTVKPLYYSISCVHPTLAGRAFARHTGHPAMQRFRQVKANGACKLPEQLDGIDHLESDAPDVYTDALWQMHEQFGIHILGGCCGTTEAHMAALGGQLARAQAKVR